MRADAGRAELRRRLVRFQVGDEIRKRARRKILARDQDARRFGCQPDRLEIRDRIVERFLVETLVEGVRAAVADEERIAVWRGLGDAGAAGHARRGADVLDHHRLPEEFAHAQRLDARADVDPAAGGERNDQRDRPRRPLLRAR
jgi:hypothetical protein